MSFLERKPHKHELLNLCRVKRWTKRLVVFSFMKDSSCSQLWFTAFSLDFNSDPESQHKRIKSSFETSQTTLAFCRDLGFCESKLTTASVLVEGESHKFFSDTLQAYRGCETDFSKYCFKEILCVLRGFKQVSVFLQAALIFETKIVSKILSHIFMDSPHFSWLSHPRKHTGLRLLHTGSVTNKCYKNDEYLLAINSYETIYTSSDTNLQQTHRNMNLLKSLDGSLQRGINEL